MVYSIDNRYNNELIDIINQFYKMHEIGIEITQMNTTTDDLSIGISITAIVKGETKEIVKTTIISLVSLYSHNWFNYCEVYNNIGSNNVFIRLSSII